MSISTIFILVFVIVGLGIAAFGARSVVHARRSAVWPHTSGEITHSEVRSSGSDGDSYSPLVRYSYVVGAKSFTGERICFGLAGMSAGLRFAQTYVHRYRVGSSVAVYYDQAQPSSSVLEPGVSKRAFIPMAFGLGFAIFGGWFALLYWLFQP